MQRVLPLLLAFLEMEVAATNVSRILARQQRAKGGNGTLRLLRLCLELTLLYGNAEAKTSAGGAGAAPRAL